MPVNQGELINVAVELSQNQGLKVSLKESGKGACIAGGGALMGGLLGGPIGLAIGGTVGSIYAAYSGSGKYKSVASVILEDMTPNQKQNLTNSIIRAFQDVQIEDTVQLARLVMSSDALKILIIQEVCKFLKNEMGLSVML